MTDSGCNTIADALESAAGRHRHVALLFSGGMESSLLLHSAKPWRSQIRVYTVRTGAEFPHMIAFIDRMLEGWDHRVVTGDLVASFHEFGIPASAVPIEHMQGIAKTLSMDERLPRIVPWPLCCARNRSQPWCEAIKTDGVDVAVHGQRASDYPNATQERLEYPGIEMIAPLWNVSRDDVGEQIRELGIELPDHYGAYSSSLDCAVCPAALTTKRRAWMKGRYPQYLAVAEKLHADVSKAVIAALDGDNTQNAFGEK
jgi:3'-phosphoadenosine 5'-phosphosulfate sulfotransferase (PAPS reductase)/FAD synthetase